MTASPATPAAPLSLRSELFRATMNCFVGSAGAGLLSYPFAAQQQGIGLNILLTLLFAVPTSFTVLAMGFFSAQQRHRQKIGSYEELVLLTLGPRLHLASMFSVMVGCLGSLVGYFIVIGDQMTDLMKRICSGAPPSGACESWNNRALLTFLFCITIALPFSCFTRMEKLVLGSTVAAASVLAVGAVIVTRGVQGVTSDLPAFFPPPPPTEPVRFFISSSSVFLGIPVSIFSLGNHIQATAVFAELSAPAARLWPIPVLCAMALCLLLYLPTGGFGYYLFRGATKGDILMNFPEDDPLAGVARALLALHIAAAIPVVVLPTRRVCRAVWGACGYPGAGLTLGDVLRCRCGRRRRQQDDASAALLRDDDAAEKTGSVSGAIAAPGASLQVEASGAAPPSSSPTPLQPTTWGSRALFLLQNAVIVFGCAGVAITIPQLQVVFGLMGAVLSSSQIFLFPGLMLLAWAAAGRSGGAASAPSAASLEANPLRRATPWAVPSHRAARVIGLLLICLCTFIAVVGTVTYVRSEFF